VALIHAVGPMTDDDTRYGAYAPPPEDYDTFDAREEEQDRRGWLFLAASAVVFVLFVAVVYNTFQLGVRERDQSPVIAADAEPYRVAPEDPGGYETPDQDLSAYELREGGDDAASETPPPARDVQEEPVTAPAEPDRLPALQVETANADQMDAPATDVGASEPAASDPEPSTPPRQDPPARTETVQRPPEPQAPVAEPDPAPVRTVAALDGAYVAQIGAFRSQEDAESGWIAFTARFSDVAVGYAPDIQRADLGDRGVFHRLRVAAFASRQDAAEFCATLDARGQACLVARR